MILTSRRWITLFGIEAECSRLILTKTVNCEILTTKIGQYAELHSAPIAPRVKFRILWTELRRSIDGVEEVR